jgi:hypothetical protein
MFDNDCPIYFVNPSDLVGGVDTPPPDPTGCDNICNCGYIQFESLLPYLDEIKRIAKWDKEESDELEMRLREQIIEISRLFDIQAGVKPGFFTKAHFTTTQVFPTNGTRYIKIPDFVQGTMSVRTTDDHLLADGSWGIQDGFLVYLPCSQHITCGCSWGCTRRKSRRPRPWPAACYKVTARWGLECADMAVQMAIRDYLIETYRVQDPVVIAATGLPISRTFKLPYSWSSYVSNFRAKREIYSKFAFA